MRMDSKAAGADGIPTALLLKPSLPPLLGAEREQGDGLTQSLPSGKEAATQIAGAMHVVFQSISSSAMVPEQWHTALLMPIYKGQLADPSRMGQLQAIQAPVHTRCCMSCMGKHSEPTAA
jgi:hypothetical protein